MKRLLINAAFPDELRIAQVEDRGGLRNLEVEDLSDSRLQNSLYKARVVDLSTNLEAAFVDFGEERNGFLPLKNIAEEYYSHLPEGARSIQDVLNAGDDIIVQVKVDKSEHENKGALLTTIVSLPGNYLVLHPNAPGISLPRNFSGDDRSDARVLMERLRLPQGMGVILRSQGLRQDVSVLQEELDLLAGLWSQVQTAAADCPAPTLLLHEPVVLFRILRDYLDDRIDEIIVDTHKAHRSVLTWVHNFKPSYEDRVVLYEESLPLFTRYQVEEDAQCIYERQAPLASGGSLVIDHTEAMTTIDVNSGSAQGRDMEDTAFRTNLEAADEIARQLRLRDIGGQIVIDFIDMKSEDNRKRVNKRFQDALRSDHARPNIGEISDFGLLSMTRKRMRPSVGDAYTEACPHCNGWGRQRTGKSLAMSVLRRLEMEASKPGTVEIVALVSVELSNFLFNEYRRSLMAIERYFNVSMVVIPSVHISGSRYKLHRHSKRTSDTDLGEQAKRSHTDRELQKSLNRQQRMARPARRPVLQHPHDGGIAEGTSQRAASPARRRGFLSLFTSGRDRGGDAEAGPRGRQGDRRKPASGSLLRRIFGLGENKTETVGESDRRTDRDRTAGRRQQRPPRQARASRDGGGRQRNRQRQPWGRERSGQDAREENTRGEQRQQRQQRQRQRQDSGTGRPPRQPRSESSGAPRREDRSRSQRPPRQPAAPRPQQSQDQGSPGLRRPPQDEATRRQNLPPASEEGKVSDNFYLRRRGHAPEEGNTAPPRPPRERGPTHPEHPSSEQEKVSDNFYLRRRGRAPEEGNPATPRPPGERGPMRPERQRATPASEQGTGRVTPGRRMRAPDEGTSAPAHPPGGERGPMRPERQRATPASEQGTGRVTPGRRMRAPDEGTSAPAHPPGERGTAQPKDQRPAKRAAPAAGGRFANDPRRNAGQREKLEIQTEQLPEPGRSSEGTPPRQHSPAPPAPPVQRAPNDPRGLK